MKKIPEYTLPPEAWSGAEEFFNIWNATSVSKTGETGRALIAEITPYSDPVEHRRSVIAEVNNGSDEGRVNTGRIFARYAPVKAIRGMGVPTATRIDNSVDETGQRAAIVVDRSVCSKCGKPVPAPCYGNGVQINGSSVYWPGVKNALCTDCLFDVERSLEDRVSDIREIIVHLKNQIKSIQRCGAATKSHEGDSPGDDPLPYKIARDARALTLRSFPPDAEYLIRRWANVHGVAQSRIDATFEFRKDGTAIIKQSKP